LEIWIRSQDRLNLILVSRLTAAKEIDITGKSVADKFTIRTMYNHTNMDRYFETLGSYETKERAIEVLDEIQSCIIRSAEKKSKQPDIYTSYWNNVFAVYQMPKE